MPRAIDVPPSGPLPLGQRGVIVGNVEKGDPVMASAVLNPYLNFRDNTREAMEFYHGVFGGTLHMMTFKEFQASQDPSEDDKIMHAQLEADGIVFMAADTPNHMEYEAGSNFSMSLSGEDEARLRGYFEQLADSGMELQALEKAPWGDTFGMLVDRYGVRWLVNVNEGES
jgi:PhnB protein